MKLILLLLIFFSAFAPILGSSFLSYPNKTIQTDGENDSLKVTSIPRIFNWTHDNIPYFVIYPQLSFEFDLEYGCIIEDISVTFAKEKTAKEIWGYCITEIEGDNQFIYAQCHKKKFRDEEIDCATAQNLIHKFEITEAKNDAAASESQHNWFSLLLMVIIAVIVGTLGTDLCRYLFSAFLQFNCIQKFRNKYLPLSLQDQRYAMEPCQQPQQGNDQH